MGHKLRVLASNFCRRIPFGTQGFHAKPLFMVHAYNVTNSFEQIVKKTT